MGAEDHVSLYPAYLPHEFNSINRRQTYAWFNRWLANKDLGVDEAPFDSSPPEALNCTSTGQVLTSLKGRSVVQVNSDRARALAARSPFRGQAAKPVELRGQVRNALRVRLALPSVRSPLRTRILSVSEAPDVTVEEFDFYSDEHVRVPGWFMKPRGTEERLPSHPLRERKRKRRGAFRGQAR